MGIEGVENLMPEEYLDGNEGPRPADSGAIPQTLKYRRKPHDVEAMQFDGTIASFNKIDKWVKSKTSDDIIAVQEMPSRRSAPVTELVIVLHGVFPVREGDWVVVRGDGQIAPSARGFFKDNYEPIED
jgi:hypothetical protein